MHLGVTNWPAGTAREEICPAKPLEGWHRKNMAMPVLQNQQILRFFTHPKYIEYGFGYLQRINMLCILFVCIYTLT